MTRRQRWDYDEILNGVLVLGDAILALIQTLIIAFGALVGLIVLGIVEHNGIQTGLDWFLEDSNMAWFAALAMIIFNMIVEFMIVHIEDVNDFHMESQTKWSLRLMVGNLGYRIGLGENWEPLASSPAHRFYTWRALTTVAIFILALAGRMQQNIEKVSMIQGNAGVEVAVPVMDGLHQLVTQSTLADIFTWAGGMVFTMVALFGMQGLTNYIAVRVVHIRGAMEKRERVQRARETRKWNARHPGSNASTGLPLEGSTGKRVESTGSAMGYSKNMSARAIVERYYAEHPYALESQSLNEVVEHIKAGGQSVGKSTVGNVRSEMLARISDEDTEPVEAVEG
ncbi:MAG: hypothetical protein K8L99_02445 [Anaerolineae bacterium]|nr:hypothetical protein [Anaerolineae bacterium]